MTDASAAVAVEMDSKYSIDEVDTETDKLIAEMLDQEEKEQQQPPEPQKPRVRNRTATTDAYAVPSAVKPAAAPTINVWTAECESLYAWCRHLNTLCVLVYTASAILSLCLCLLYHITTHRTLVLERFTASAALEYAPSWSVAPVWLVPPVLFVSAFTHLLLHYMRKKTWRERWMVEQRNPLRWLDHVITVPLLMLSLAIFCGLNSYAELLLLYVCQWVASVSGSWLMRTVNPLRPPQPRLWMPTILSTTLHVCCWAALGMPVMAAPTVTPAAVLAIYWSAAPVALLAVPLITVYAYRGGRSLAQYIKSECAVTVTHLLFKTLIAWQIVGNSIST
jgi:hypothetical protein